ncbi:MAG: L,D-transpeptidase [Desulfobacula sp.]|nr:L,D-transpeptidase [Desulfobacula sp.]
MGLVFKYYGDQVAKSGNIQMRKTSPKLLLNIRTAIGISLFVFLLTAMLPLMVHANLPDNPVDIQIYDKKEAFNIIVVQKFSQQLTVYSANDGYLKTILQFPCSTGKIKGNKKIEGDAKTPSGVYFITGEFLDKDLSRIYGTRAFPLDYPNALDRKNSRNGSAIWLHGTDKILQPYQTNGCVAMDNQNINLLKSYIRFNRTPVIIVGSLGSIIIAKNSPWQTFLDKALQNRKRSLLSGPYHDYLSMYHPDYLPDMAWWRPWIKLRSKFNDNTPVDVERRNILAVSMQKKVTVLFDQYLVSYKKKKLVGSLKFFLEPYKNEWRITAEEYQQIPSKNDKVKNQHPILLAGRSLQDQSISKQEIEPIVDSWLMAWSKKDIISYSAFYSKDFKSQKGQNLNQWISYKKRLNNKYKYIKVTRKGLKIKQINKQIHVSFIQHYKNNQFKNVTNKTLVFKFEKGNWKILKELAR